MDRRPHVLALHPIELATEPALRVGRVEIDTRSREARFGGNCERLQPQVLKVLVYLHHNRDRVVSRDELIAFCWGGRFVGEDVINRSISLLRRFAERAGGFQIDTIPKAGYRLVENDVDGTYSKGSGKKARLIGAAMALLLIGGSGAFLYWRAGRAPLPESPSVVFAPIAARNAVERDLAFDINSQLSQALSQTGFAVGTSPGRAPDLRIEGRLHSSARKVDLDLSVIEVRSGTVMLMRHLQAPSERAATIAPQAAALIATSISWNGPYLALNPANRVDPKLTAQLTEVLALHSEHRDYMRAYEIARRIAPKMPRSAIAQVAYAMGTGFVLGDLPIESRRRELERARAAAQRSLRLQRNYGDGHLPWCVLHPKVWYVRCEAQLREGLRIEPAASSVPGYLSGVLIETGRIEESLARLRQTYSNNPYKLGRVGGMLATLGYAGRGAEAEELYRQARVYWPDHPELPARYLNGLIAAGDFKRASAFAAKQEPSDPAISGALVTEIIRAVDEGNRGVVEARCDRARPPATMTQLCIISLARVGNLDRAFAIADAYLPRLKGATTTIEEAMWLARPRAPSVAFLSAPALVPLRRDARFLALAEKVGLLAVWRSGRLPDFCTRRREPVCAVISR